MNTVYLLIAGLISFFLAYRFYARYLSRILHIDPTRATPAHTMQDGVDYVPARRSVLIGHHFSSIAGAAPIIGPVTAAAYGWAPVLLWIILGAVFLGAVHDLSALVVSIRHQGKSMGDVIYEYLGTAGSLIFLFFCWAALILIIAVFMAVVAKTFVAQPETVTASLLYLILAVIFGFLLNKTRFTFGVLTLICVPLVFFGIYVGTVAPVSLSETISIAGLSLSPAQAWSCVLIIYIFIASVTPVWLLLQPRDYLSSFLLYALIAVSTIGIFVAHQPVQIPAIANFMPASGPLFPMLFVIVACGAISGFHSLVAAGTTAKQLNSEKDAVPVGYGSMLIEGVLAIVALAAAVKLSTSEYSVLLKDKGPIYLFAHGIGSFLDALHLPNEAGMTFATLAVSAFALTTLDTATRLGRFSLQEISFILSGGHGEKNTDKNSLPSKTDTHKKPFTLDRYTATLITVIPAGALALTGQWKVIWPLFGAANQLLAALSLITVTLWLYYNRRPVKATLIPAVFMCIVTLSALVYMICKDAVVITQNFTYAAAIRIGLATLLFLLALLLVILVFIKRHNRYTHTEGHLK